jgi:hypothetical protein
MGWAEYMTVEGDSYFRIHNACTAWHHPLDIVSKQLVEVQRRNDNAYRPGQTCAQSLRSPISFTRICHHPTLMPTLMPLGAEVASRYGGS